MKVVKKFLANRAPYQRSKTIGLYQGHGPLEGWILLKLKIHQPNMSTGRIGGFMK